VGLMLYVLTTGRLPFPGGPTKEDTRQQILTGCFPRPRELKPEVPEALEAVILKAMALSRDDRYPDARAFLAALRAAMPEVSTAAPLSAAALPLAPSLPPAPRDAPSGVTTAASATGAGTVLDRTRARSQPTRPPRPRRRLAAWALGLLALLAAAWPLAHFLRGRSVAAAAGAVGPAGAELRFGITQYLPAGDVAAAHTPFVDYLAQQLGRPVRLVILEDYVDVTDKLLAGEIDVAALSPYSYVRARRKAPGLQLLASPVTEGGSSYEGLVLARAGSGVARVPQPLPDQR